MYTGFTVIRIFILKYLKKIINIYNPHPLQIFRGFLGEASPLPTGYATGTSIRDSWCDYCPSAPHWLRPWPSPLYIAIFFGGGGAAAPCPTAGNGPVIVLSRIQILCPEKCYVL